uniref:Calpain catalytic domain-containing protein n=1 Tax=Heterorhabditis bacteriophora TaxID=37862 RepID=A0A1I7WKU3_HETBA
MVLNIRGDGKGISILTPYSYNHSIERYCGLRLYWLRRLVLSRRNVNFLWFDGWFVKIVVSDQESICDLWFCPVIRLDLLTGLGWFRRISGGGQEFRENYWWQPGIERDVYWAWATDPIRILVKNGYYQLLPTYLIDSVSAICLRKRLRPCMYCSTNGETANADIIYSVIFLDNCGNSGANTCINAPTSEGNRPIVLGRSLLTLNNAAYRRLVQSVCPINLMSTMNKGSLRNGYHIQGRQQARNLSTPNRPFLWNVDLKSIFEYLVEGKSGASSRGNSSSTSVNRHCSRR